MRLQWSTKLDNGEIFVVEVTDSDGDYRSRFEEEVIYLKGLITNTPSNTVDQINKKIEVMKQNTFVEEMEEENKLTDDSYCSEHKVTMKERKDPKGGVFYSHARQLKDGSWDYCSGRGWKSEK